MMAPELRQRAKDRYTLDFEYTYQYDDDRVSFALSMPYTSEDLKIDTHRWYMETRGQKE